MLGSRARSHTPVSVVERIPKRRPSCDRFRLSLNRTVLSCGEPNEIPSGDIVLLYGIEGIDDFIGAVQHRVISETQTEVSEGDGIEGIGPNPDAIRRNVQKELIAEAPVEMRIAKLRGRLSGTVM